MSMCKKCCMYCGVLTLVVGVLFLLADLGVWDWGISWWTAAFLLLGLGKWGKSRCKECD